MKDILIKVAISFMIIAFMVTFLYVDGTVLKDSTANADGGATVLTTGTLIILIAVMIISMAIFNKDLMKQLGYTLQDISNNLTQMATDFWVWIQTSETNLTLTQNYITDVQQQAYEYDENYERLVYGIYSGEVPVPPNALLETVRQYFVSAGDNQSNITNNGTYALESENFYTLRDSQNIGLELPLINVNTHWDYVPFNDLPIGSSEQGLINYNAINMTEFIQGITASTEFAKIYINDYEGFPAYVVPKITIDTSNTNDYKIALWHECNGASGYLSSGSAWHDITQVTPYITMYNMKSYGSYSNDILFAVYFVDNATNTIIDYVMSDINNNTKFANFDATQLVRYTPAGEELFDMEIPNKDLPMDSIEIDTYLPEQGISTTPEGVVDIDTVALDGTSIQAIADAIAGTLNPVNVDDIPDPDIPDTYSKWKLPKIVITKFPFSLPWDFIGLLKLLEQPAMQDFLIDMSFDFQMGTYQSEIPLVIDLADLGIDKIALITQWVLGLMFALGLIMLFRKLSMS